MNLRSKLPIDEEHCADIYNTYYSLGHRNRKNIFSKFKVEL